MADFTFRFISTSDGVRLRTGLFEPEKKSRQVCVLLSGQTEFIEKYFEVIGELNDRGFVVTTFDWRGQGGSARALSDPLKAHIGDFTEYDIDLASFMEQVVAPLSPVTPLLLAHSMGGHIALRALHNHPSQFRAAILSAPMLGFSTRGYPSALVRTMTAVQSRIGRASAFAWGMEKRDPFKVDFSTQLCTTDVQRFARTQNVLLAHPAIRLAGPTWGWINAAYRSLKAVNAPGYAEAITTPALVFGAGRDRIVLTEATRKFTDRLPHGKYVALDESEHEMLMERDAIRHRFWHHFDAFLERL